MTVLYHVTFASALHGIAEDGLDPMSSSGAAMGAGGGLRAYSRGRVFLTDGPGVFYWMSTAHAHAEDRSDDPVDDGYIPVAIEVHVPPSVTLEVDGPGTYDARQDAFFTEDPIPPEALRVWNGTEWVTVADADLADLQERAADVEEVDGEELRWLIDPLESSLLPTDLPSAELDL